MGNYKIINKKWSNSKIFKTVEANLKNKFAFIPKDVEESSIPKDVEDSFIPYPILELNRLILFSDRKIYIPSKDNEDKFNSLLSFLGIETKEKGLYTVVTLDKYNSIKNFYNTNPQLHLDAIRDIDETYAEVISYLQKSEDLEDIDIGDIDIEEALNNGTNSDNDIVLVTRCMGKLNLSDANIESQQKLEQLLRRMVIILSRVQRYSGQIEQPYSVLEHSYKVAEYARSLYGGGKLAEIVYKWGLLHEFFEGITGIDIPSPIKHSGHFEHIRELEQNWLLELFIYMFPEHIESYNEINSYVKKADSIIGLVEGLTYIAIDEETKELFKEVSDEDTITEAEKYMTEFKDIENKPLNDIIKHYEQTLGIKVSNYIGGTI